MFQKIFYNRLIFVKPMNDHRNCRHFSESDNLLKPPYAVNNQRFFKLICQFDLLFKSFFLNFSWNSNQGVQAAFPNGNTPWHFSSFHETFEMLIETFRVGRMYSNREKDILNRLISCQVVNPFKSVGMVMVKVKKSINNDKNLVKSVKRMFYNLLKIS